MIGLEGVINDKRSQRLLARVYVRVLFVYVCTGGCGGGAGLRRPSLTSASLNSFSIALKSSSSLASLASVWFFFFFFPIMVDVGTC